MPIKKSSTSHITKLTNVKTASKLLPMAGMIDHTKYPPLSGYYTISQVAKLLGRKRQAVYMYARRYAISMIRMGDVIIIPKSQLKKFKYKKKN